MESNQGHSLESGAEVRIALFLCAAVVLGWAMQHIVPERPDYAGIFGPDWLPVAAAGFAAAGLVPLNGSSRWLRAQTVVRWIGFGLMVWAANGLPLDLLRAVGLIPLGVDWPGLATRALALAAVIVLARLLLANAAPQTSARAANWYGYAACVFALPYPILRTHWALGGTLGIRYPGAAGAGFAPWLISIPFWLAAVLSLLLVSPPRWMPRWMLLAAGWSATALVGMVGPAGAWAFFSSLARGNAEGSGDIAAWVFGLFYGSWFLFAIAAGAATRAYQLRSAAGPMASLA